MSLPRKEPVAFAVAELAARNQAPLTAVRQCAWPLWRQGERSGRFCGEPVAAAGKPYCAQHFRQAYNNSSGSHHGR